MTEYLFHQTEQKGKEGILVKPDEIYLPGSEYGFFTEKSHGSSLSFSLPEINTGFVPAPGFGEEIRIKQDKLGCYVDSKSTYGDIPLSFQANVKTQGNYLLSVTLCAGEEEPEVLVFVGRRQLVFQGSLKVMEEWNGAFPVSVCDFIPRGQTERFPDQGVKISVISRSVRIKKLMVEPWIGKTIFLAGDSTLTDQTGEYPYAPNVCYGGWGQMLPAYLKGDYTVSNHAHSGLTTESFRGEGHHEIMMEGIGKGDICLFQFGHNDQKLDHLKADEGYRKNLMEFVKEIRGKEALPVLVTPLARNSWIDNGATYNDLLKDYAKEVIGLGAILRVPVVDLHGKSMELMKENGMEESKQWFYPLDYTHTNDYGAFHMAGYVWKELLDLGVISASGREISVWVPSRGDAWLSYEKGEHL